MAKPASSVYAWTKDIALTGEQMAANLRGPTGPLNPQDVRARAEAWAARCRRRGAEMQAEGRRIARQGDDPVHLAGCMLYLSVYKTSVVQHVYGAIQEYAGFDEPRWLDCSF